MERIEDSSSFDSRDDPFDPDSARGVVSADQPDGRESDEVHEAPTDVSYDFDFDFEEDLLDEDEDEDEDEDAQDEDDEDDPFLFADEDDD